MMKGVVVSVYSKTAVVLIERKRIDHFYKKAVSYTSKIKVHDNLGLKIGDVVLIDKTRPRSKDKSWIAVRKLGEKILKIKRYDNS